MDSLIRSARIAAVILTGWMIAAVFFSWQNYRLALGRGETGTYGLWLVEMSATMLLWAFFTPPLLFAGERLPIRKPRRLRNVLLVSLVASAIALIRASIDVMLGLAFVGYIASMASIFHKYLLFAFIVIGIANFIRLEAEEAARQHAAVRVEAEAAEAVLRQLWSDLNPHFLFNTINDVAMLLHSEPAAAVEMLGKIREYLRRAMETEHAREVRLADELEFVSRYFDIQKMRFRGKLTTRIDVSSARLNDAAVPPLLLQPLVENSIVHGLAGRREGGCVAVIVDEEHTDRGTMLRMQVHDNGPGCTPEVIFAKARVGVANAIARLESLYGPRQSLTYENHGDGFVARVLIPLRMLPR